MLYPLIEEVCAKLVKYTKEISEKNPKNGQDTRELAAKYTTDVVSTCIFAMDAGSFTKEKPEIREVGRRMMQPNFTIVLKLMIFGMFPFLKKLFKAAFISKEVEVFFTDLMNQALRYRKDNHIARVDYLDYLIQLKEKKSLTELDLAAHTVTFFVDGFETSSVFIAHALFLVSSTNDIIWIRHSYKIVYSLTLLSWQPTERLKRNSARKLQRKLSKLVKLVMTL